MKIDKEWIEGQIKTLEEQKQAMANQLVALEGALQQCRHLLKVLEMEKPEGEEVPNLEDLLPAGAKIADDRTPNEKGEADGKSKKKKTNN